MSAQVVRSGAGVRAACRDCGWKGPVRHETAHVASREANRHACPPREDINPLHTGEAHHSCGGKSRKPPELVARKVGGGIWRIACSACRDEWEFDQGGNDQDGDDTRMNPMRNADDEVRRLERAVAEEGPNPENVARLERAYARAGLIQRQPMWVVEHTRHKGGRGQDSHIVIGRLIVGVYSGEDEAYRVAAAIAIRDRWKLRNREGRRLFTQAEESGDTRRIVGVYSTETDYALHIERVTPDAEPATRGGFDRENWKL